VHNIRNIVLMIALLLGGLSSFSQVVKSKKNYLTICSFNVYKFGAIDIKYKEISAKLKKPDFVRSATSFTIPGRIKNCAEVLSKGEFDLIVLQEVKSGAVGDSVLKDLTNELNSYYGGKFKWLTSEKIGKGMGMYECMAFLYDSTKVALITQNGQLSSTISCDEPKNRKYVKTCWKAGNFDFTLISCHFAWNGKDYTRRLADYRKLNHMLHHPLEYSNDPDLIVVGDFNRFGGPFKKSENQFGIQNISYDSLLFRVPHVAHFDREIIKLKEVGKKEGDSTIQQYSTTVANGNAYVYDLFWITSDVLEEYKLSGNQINQDFGVLVYDETWGNAYVKGTEQLSASDLKKQFSDHRPIWMRFKINTNNED